MSNDLYIPVSKNLPKTLKVRYGLVLDAAASKLISQGHILEYDSANKFIHQYYT